MGADGGVIYMPLKKPTQERYDRVIELIKPFWQFTNENGSSWAEDSFAEWWKQNKTIHAPNYLIGYYGTDRDMDLEDLQETISSVLEPDNWFGYLCDFTFSDLDLDVRTSPWIENRNPIMKLYSYHFKYCDREEYLKNIGALANIKINDWAKELSHLLNYKQLYREETWT